MGARGGIGSLGSEQGSERFLSTTSLASVGLSVFFFF